MTRNTVLKHPAIKPLVFLVCLIPFAWAATNLGLAYFREPHALGANPIEAFIRFSGDWGMRFLILTLAISPLAKLTRTSQLVRFRRMLGLYAFFYAFVHLFGYVGFDQIFYWALIWEDIVKRNFITIGMVAFAMMLPLAITSTNRMIRRLGAKRWQKLHRLVYPAAILVIVHYYMMVKADATEPLVYGGILAVLLLARQVRIPNRKAAPAKAPSGAPPVTS